MRSRQVLLQVMLFTMLGACSSMSYITRIQRLSESGQCAAAEAEANSSVSDPGQRATIMGIIADECRRDYVAAIGYMSLGARYGDTAAQSYLASKGKPVPPADLKNKTTNCMVLIGGMVSCSSN